ncbi:keratin-associated protein 5-8-like [Eriocheir sinensis]|uniref:keratin-associated protein 5-8-like n=1 Tax=Eriocheir sinensis TaxID=95602 RepID=UPI0021C7944A|nr:keratin-associated protein 5-8-like [Eriocheir sinensis]
MRTALIVGLLALLALDVCHSKAGGDKQGDASRSVDAETKNRFDTVDGNWTIDGNRDVCSTAGCGTSLLGTCRVYPCMPGERFSGCCDGPCDCGCCGPCEAGSCDNGRCVDDSSSCNTDEYSDGECFYGGCTCCKTCQASNDCASAGGQCINAEATCGTGLSPMTELGCTSNNCKCCAPVCTPSSACTDGPNPGVCVTNEDFCDADDEYLTDDGCGNAGCTCCKTCRPDNFCARKNGICVNPAHLSEPTRPPHNRCPAGYHHFQPGTCGTDDCICCIPRPQNGG